jgi:hypothetical protein
MVHLAHVVGHVKTALLMSPLMVASTLAVNVAQISFGDTLISLFLIYLFLGLLVGACGYPAQRTVDASGDVTAGVLATVIASLGAGILLGTLATILVNVPVSAQMKSLFWATPPLWHLWLGAIVEYLLFGIVVGFLVGIRPDNVTKRRSRMRGQQGGTPSHGG